MKKIVMLVMMMSISMAVCDRARCEEGGAYFKWGQIEFTYPLSNISASPAMLDCANGLTYMGVETSLATWPATDMPVGQVVIPANLIDLDFGGAAIPFKSQAMPYGGFNIQIGKLFPNAPWMLPYIGVWGGHDFTVEDHRIFTGFGIKASKRVW
jgi:hypothetical protein